MPINYDDSLNPLDDFVRCEECGATKREDHPCRICRLQAAIDRAEEEHER